ncbi:Peroxin 13, N-terminal region-domain-containing protein [Schizophyllum amplum]|uniref:Peroxisomal membrane protein PEX13 n=1 Tax=Schizophyllum amplum TaxID=97359 RepID=A0A550BY52_9AGAR|nr:Peroxin 13, N-terminal region-domain-containing protein [Auriculariopsis ampla]
MGYGGYGGGMGYGGMGMGMGYGGMGGMFPGQPQLDANGQPIPSLTQTLESTTQQTFGLIQSIVQTFSGVAQMLESTFMATHSSFFAMVGVIEQFGHLRNALGSVLGLFGLVRWMRETLTGRPAGAARLEGEFRDFVNGRPIPAAGGPGGPPQKISKKPIFIFLLAVLGIPYAMTKLIRILAKRQQEQQALLGIPGSPLSPLDPAKLTFARALYPFEPTNQNELGLKENEIVAVMGKLDPRTGAEVDPRLEVPDGEWWKGRTRDGREGWFPRKWVDLIERKEKKVDP